MENIKITHVYAEMTPNPATMRFVADRAIINGNGIIEYFSAAEAQKTSPLGEQLFAFPFVKSLMFGVNYVTVTKTDNISWDFVTMEVREFIQHYLRNNQWAVTEIPEKIINEVNSKTNAGILAAHAEPKNELEYKIIQALDEYVIPAVENDGGAIHFKSFSKGRVNLVMRGSCSGCPSSTITLKNGIENLLKQMIPEVTEVVAEKE